jgi:hypothetical protein
MLRNLIDETYLKGYAVKLSALLYTDEADWSEHKKKATTRVLNALSQSYDLRQLMPEVYLRSSGNSISAEEIGTGVEDTMNRMRLVIDNISNTVSSKVLTLQGSENNENFYDIDTVTITTSDTIVSFEFFYPYKYYRINSAVITGACDFRAYLVETIYDELFACMWLYFIFMDIMKQEGDQYDLKAKEFYRVYESLMIETKRYLDIDNDGEVDATSQNNSLTMLK